MVGTILPVEDPSLLLSKIRDLLVDVRAQDMILKPQPDDEDNYTGDTQTVAASAVTTITWTLKSDYEYFFKKLFVDKISNITYLWTFSNVKGFYSGQLQIEGNEHEFDKPVRAAGGSTLKLKITNNTTAKDLDISLRSWGRRINP